MNISAIRFVLFSFLVIISTQSQALVLTPGGEYTNESFYPAYGNPDAADISVIVGSTVNLLYKDNVGGIEEGMANFMSSYDTTFSNTLSDPSDALISFQGGDIMTDADWLLVKDGNHDPIWYLFDVSSWDGLADIELIDFWPTQGAISHVSIFGGDSSTAIPEPGTLVLLGTGLLILNLARRKRN